MKATTYQGSWQTKIDGIRYHVFFTYQLNEDGNMINEKETKRIKL